MNRPIGKLTVMRTSLQRGCVGLVLAACVIAPPLASAQAPWMVTVVPTMNPLPIGYCAAIHLTVFNASGGDVPRNPRGNRVTMADFDIVVSAPNGYAAAQQIDAYHWSVCGCQGGIAGTVGTVTATYPAQALVAESRVPGVSFQKTATFVLAPAKGTANSPACLTAGDPAINASPTGGAASSLRPTSTIVAATPVALAPAPAAAPAAALPVAVAATPVALPVALAPAPAPTSTMSPTSVALSPALVALNDLPATRSEIVPTPATPSTPAAPAAINPTGFTAKQDGPDQVELSWQTVAGASYYVVLGPGLPAGGAKIVGMTTARATAVASGSQQWAVASYYEPGPVSTAAAEFPRVTLNVTAPFPPVAPTSTAKWTNFDPVKHGFRFVNDFMNNFVGPPVNMTTNGLCGGMTYTVLDYYYAGRPIPKQEYRPANATPLMMYLYGRQYTSLMSNLDKWTETTVNPLGVRTTEFFNWGINERLRELMMSIDRGVPVPLGLKGGLLSAGTLSHDHQVLAIGYDIGRYRIDLGDYIQDVKIYIFDPNHPTKVVTLVPDPVSKEYRYLEHANERWRTYFVDGKYLAMTPPNIVTPSYPGDGLAHELLFRFFTGADDLRGGADHVDVTITLSDNTSRHYPNVSQDGRWLPQYAETAQVVLVPPVPHAMIRTIAVSTNATGGVSGDNWDLFHLTVTAVGGGFTRELLDATGGLYRFTGARTPLVIDVQ